MPEVEIGAGVPAHMSLPRGGRILGPAFSIEAQPSAARHAQEPYVRIGQIKLTRRRIRTSQYGLSPQIVTR